MKSQRAIHPVLFGIALMASALWSLEAAAVSVMFLKDPGGFDIGFDPDTPDFPTTPELILPSGLENYVAGDTDGIGPVQLGIAAPRCLFAPGESVCRDLMSNPIGDGNPFSEILTLTLDSVEGGLPAEGIVLFLSGIRTDPGDPDYSFKDVLVELDPEPFAGKSFDDFIYMTRTGTTSGGDPFTDHYFGFRLEQIGQSVTFQYDVLAALDGTPVFTTNALIPEPSTALLLGLGLAGLTAVRRR